MVTKPTPRSRRGDAADIADIEAGIVALRRSYRRRTLSRLARQRGARAGRDAALPDAVFELLDALAAAADQTGTTVTEAAAVLDVDQPRASRLAAQAIDAGLLQREADPYDGRRSLLVLTARGRSALDQIRTFRQGIVAAATSGWTSAERAELARLLTRFVRDFAALTDGQGKS